MSSRSLTTGKILLLCLLVVAAAAGLWGLMTYVVADKKLLLSYVEVLRWPLIIGFVLYWLRHPLREKIRQVLKLDLGGVASFEFQAAEELGEVVRHDVDQLTGPPREETSADTEAASADGDDPSGEAPTPEAQPAPEVSHQPPRAETHSRDAVENIIQKSAAWGFRMGRSGAPEVVPDIEWNPDGSWRITTEVPATTARVSVAQGTAPSRRQSVRNSTAIERLEGQIIEMEKDHYRFGGGIGVLNMRDEGYLRELKRRLRQIDPGNPYAM